MKAGERVRVWLRRVSLVVRTLCYDHAMSQMIVAAPDFGCDCFEHALSASSPRRIGFAPGTMSIRASANKLEVRRYIMYLS